MNEPSAGPPAASQPYCEVSLLSVGSVLLRWRRTIIVLTLVGAAAGLARGLLTPRVYACAVKFLPQSSGTEGSLSGLALAASQFGIRVPASGGGWGPPVYVDLLRSRALLEPIALDTLTVAEQGGLRVTVADLLGITGATSSRRTDRVVRALARVVTSREAKDIGAVEVTATTRWPSVSLALVERLVGSVNRFNLEARKSQASAERQFIESQADTAERALRAAEDRLQTFLQRNRMAGAPDLRFEQDRLQRDVLLRQQVYTSLLQSQEEARIREVRDTPVITVLEGPLMPVVPESRKVVLKGMLGAVAGGVLGCLLALLAHGLVSARQRPGEEAREFFRLVDEATPRLLRRGSTGN